MLPFGFFVWAMRGERLYDTVPDEPGLWAVLAPNEREFFYDPPVFAEKTDELAGSFDFVLIETPPGFWTVF